MYITSRRVDKLQHKKGYIIDVILCFFFIQSICVTELYMPSHKLLPVFSCCGYNKSSLLSASQVREVVTSYVKTNELVSAQNPK